MKGHREFMAQCALCFIILTHEHRPRLLPGRFHRWNVQMMIRNRNVGTKMADDRIKGVSGDTVSRQK